MNRRGFFRMAGALAAGRLAPLHAASKYDRALAHIDELFAAEYAKPGAASIVAGVVSGPELIWTKTYGLADIDSGTQATVDHVYRIGSITKQFTAIALLQLVKRGKVRLSDPAEKYLPEINLVQGRFAGSPPVTLLQLATHTSGLDREPGDTAVYTQGPVSDWDKTLIEGLKHTRYLYEPGTRQSYSNIAVGSLGLALGRAAGVPYIDYVRQNILQPLGLKNTSFEPDAAVAKRVATGYELRDGKPDSTVPLRELRTGRGYKVPNGALFTTIGDLSRLVSLELGHGPSAVIEKETLADNFSRIFGADGKLGGGFGIGFSLARRGDLVYAGHGGSVAGFQAGAYFHAPSDTGILFLRNLGKGIRNDLFFDGFNAIAGA